MNTMLFLDTLKPWVTKQSRPLTFKILHCYGSFSQSHANIMEGYQPPSLALLIDRKTWYAPFSLEFMLDGGCIHLNETCSFVNKYDNFLLSHR